LKQKIQSIYKIIKDLQKELNLQYDNIDLISKVFDEFDQQSENERKRD
jgi:hypothetical protein